MIRRLGAGLALLVLAGCASAPGGPAPSLVKVEIIAFNDFHGNLEPPKRVIIAPLPGGGSVRVPAGGAAYLASAVASLKAKNPNHTVVAAGDLVGASPMVSALFLDEPTIEAMNLIGLDYSALGNHEFDKGSSELLRIARGGCGKFTAREPCGLDKGFRGAKFGYLGANTFTDAGKTLVPPFAIKSFGKGRARVKVGFIGLTLKAAPTVVNPAGVKGLKFTDEAEAANALIPQLKKAGADAIVVLIHQGGQASAGYDDKSCSGLGTDITSILDRLDPAIDLVVSGHTHLAYVCDYGRINPAKPFLLTSAGLYGTLLTDIELEIDPAAHRVVSKRADNLIVQGEGFTTAAGSVTTTDRYPLFPKSEPVAALVERYVRAAAPLAQRPIGRMSGSATRDFTRGFEMSVGDLIGDAELAATSGPETGRAQIAMTNAGGVRGDLIPAPGGTITYGQLFAAQPFGNALVVKGLTGRQLRDLLEHQFSRDRGAGLPDVLQVSASLRYAFDLSRPVGSRVLDVTIDGRPLDEAATYRVTTNDFLAAGGAGYVMLRDGAAPLGGPQELDALEAYFAGGREISAPTPDRIRNLTP